MARKPDIQYIRFYTDGSAARKPEPRVPKKKPAPRPRAQKRKARVIRLDPLAALGIAISAVMAVLMLAGAVRLNEIRTCQGQMERYAASLEEENAQLEAQYRSGYDLDTIENTALALGMVPMEQLRQISIQVEQPQEPQPQPSFWQRIGDFFSNLFA